MSSAFQKSTPEKNHGEIIFKAIGRIYTPFLEAQGTPIQSVYSKDTAGQVIVDEPFISALDDIDGFERIWLIYFLDRTSEFKPHVIPYRDTVKHGLFATRSPCRPNPIGLSVVNLLNREGGILHVGGVDMLDGTPLLDIKPIYTTLS